MDDRAEGRGAARAGRAGDGEAGALVEEVDADGGEGVAADADQGPQG